MKSCMRVVSYRWLGFSSDNWVYHVVPQASLCIETILERKVWLPFIIKVHELEFISCSSLLFSALVH